MGSRRAARRAGIHAAARATATSIATAAANVPGSLAVTWKSMCRSKRTGLAEQVAASHHRPSGSERFHTGPLEGGRQTEQNTASQRQQQCEQQHPQVYVGLMQSRYAFGSNGDEKPQQSEREHTSCGATAQRQHGAFGQRLANEASAAATHRRAHGGFALPRCGPRQQRLATLAQATSKTTRTVDRPRGCERGDLRNWHERKGSARVRRPPLSGCE